MGPAVQATVPKTETMRRNIKRYRQLPSQIDNNLPSEHRNTTKGLPILRHDNNCLLFAADEDLHFLAGCTLWFADGTFSVSPAEFTQLYTIHGTRDGLTICVFELLSNKLKAIYTEMLTKVRDWAKIRTTDRHN